MKMILDIVTSVTDLNSNKRVNLMNEKLPKGLSIVSIQRLISAKLYNTNIVEVDSDNRTIKVNSDGHKTEYMKNCTNLVLDNFGFYLYQDNFNWFIKDLNKNIVYEYKDNLIMSL